MKESKIFTVLLSALTLLGFSFDAFALPPDFTTLTDAVDFSTAQTAILSVFASLSVVYILIRGGSLIIERIRSGK